VKGYFHAGFADAPEPVLQFDCRLTIAYNVKRRGEGVLFMPTVKLSSKNQVVIPTEARQKLGLKAGDRLKVLIKGDSICLVKEPGSYVDKLYASGRDLYSSDYLIAERDSWEK
jgi:AbrB family looped-hinge helix DNA binding protein